MLYYRYLTVIMDTSCNKKCLRSSHRVLSIVAAIRTILRVIAELGFLFQFPESTCHPRDSYSTMLHLMSNLVSTISATFSVSTRTFPESSVDEFNLYPEENIEVVKLFGQSVTLLSKILSTVPPSPSSSDVFPEPLFQVQYFKSHDIFSFSMECQPRCNFHV